MNGTWIYRRQKFNDLIEDPIRSNQRNLRLIPASKTAQRSVGPASAIANNLMRAICLSFWSPFDIGTILEAKLHED